VDNPVCSAAKCGDERGKQKKCGEQKTKELQSLTRTTLRMKNEELRMKNEKQLRITKFIF
jgi:hypothetical protein